MTFTGSVPNGTIATNVYAFYNMSVNGGTWQNITNTVTASSSLYVSGGTLSIRGSSLTVTGGAYVSGTGILQRKQRCPDQRRRFDQQRQLEAISGLSTRDDYR